MEKNFGIRVEATLGGNNSHLIYRWFKNNGYDVSIIATQQVRTSDIMYSHEKNNKVVLLLRLDGGEPLPANTYIYNLYEFEPGGRFSWSDKNKLSPKKEVLGYKIKSLMYINSIAAIINRPVSSRKLIVDKKEISHFTDAGVFHWFTPVYNLYAQDIMEEVEFIKQRLIKISPDTSPLITELYNTVILRFNIELYKIEREANNG